MLHCYDKKVRKRARTFTAKDVGRITCAAIEDGEDPREVLARAALCIPKLQEVLKKLEELRQRVIGPLEKVRKAIVFVKDIVDEVDDVLTKISKIPIIGPWVNRFVSVKLRIGIKSARKLIDEALEVVDNVLELLNALHL